MAYGYQYINKQIEKTFYSYTLLITDDEGILPSARIEKTFDKNDGTITSQKASEAQREIDILIAEQTEAQSNGDIIE